MANNGELKSIRQGTAYQLDKNVYVGTPEFDNKVALIRDINIIANQITTDVKPLYFKPYPGATCVSYNTTTTTDFTVPLALSDISVFEDYLSFKKTDSDETTYNIIAPAANYPTGFAVRNPLPGWSHLASTDYTYVTDWKTQNGGDIFFATSTNATWGNQLSIAIDGKFYQNEGNNVVLDESDASIEPTANTLVKRDANGDIKANKTLYFTDTGNPHIQFASSDGTLFYVQQTADRVDVGPTDLSSLWINASGYVTAHNSIETTGKYIGTLANTFTITVDGAAYSSFNSSANVSCDFTSIGKTEATDEYSIVDSFNDTTKSDTTIPTTAAVAAYAGTASKYCGIVNVIYTNATSATSTGTLEIDVDQTHTTNTIGKVATAFLADEATHAVSATHATSASSAVCATTASQLANSLTFAGAISAVYNGSSPCTITTSSLSVCDTSLIGITSCISSSTSTNIPTEGAVYGFASQGCTIKVTSAVDGVIYPFTGVSSISSTSQGSLYYSTKAYLLSGFLYSNGLKVDPDTQYPIIIDYTI